MDSIILHIIAEDSLSRLGVQSLLSTYQDIHIYQAVVRMEIIEWEDMATNDVFLFVIEEESQIPDFGLSHQVKALVLVDEGLEKNDFLSHGFKGIIPRSSSAEAIYTAVKAVAQGLLVLSPEFRLESIPKRTYDTLLADLTPRELEVLNLLVQGHSNKQLATNLAISENTVKFHINQLLSKFGVNSRTEVVVRAIQAGLIVV